MRLARFVFALPFVFGLGCGSDGGGADDGDDGDDDVVLVPDAGPPDSAPIDANTCPGPGNTDICNDQCVDFDTDETACGGCDQPCNGGEACGGGECACPGAIVPASPVFVQSQVQSLSGIVDIGIGGYADPGHAGVPDGLLVTKKPGDATEIGVEYPVETSIVSPPVLAAVYNADLAAQTYDSAFMAVEGTVVFDAICLDSFSGHATNVTFRGVNGELPNVTPDPNGCTFTVERVDFTFGPGCPPE